MFVREAYALLKQSIVRVEEDDIDFDEEELAFEDFFLEKRPSNAMEGRERDGWDGG